MEQLREEDTPAFKLFASKYNVRVAAMATLTDYDLKVKGVLPSFNPTEESHVAVNAPTMAEWYAGGYKIKLPKRYVVEIRKNLVEYFEDWHTLVCSRIINHHPPINDMMVLDNFLKAIDRDVDLSVKESTNGFMGDYLSIIGLSFFNELHGDPVEMDMVPNTATDHFAEILERLALRNRIKNS